MNTDEKIQLIKRIMENVKDEELRDDLLRNTIESSNESKVQPTRSEPSQAESLIMTAQTLGIETKHLSEKLEGENTVGLVAGGFAALALIAIGIGLLTGNIMSGPSNGPPIGRYIGLAFVVIGPLQLWMNYKRYKVMEHVPEKIRKASQS